MTPKEQDKELLKKIDKIMPQCGEDNCYTCNNRHKRVLKLITADRRRVALDARLYDNERTLAHIQNGMPIERLKIVVENRIAELKSQQEKL